jgi:hypothetical protein
MTDCRRTYGSWLTKTTRCSRKTRGIRLFNSSGIRLFNSKRSVVLSYRALAVEVPDGMVWFWIGSHAEYNEKIKGEGT